MHKRDFLSIVDFSSDELTELLNRARRLKVGEDHSRLTGKSLAMIFRKSSTRTRISFEVGMTQLGGHALFISDHDSQIGRGEPIHDTAKVLSRYVDGIMIRTFGHEEVEELSRHSSVPVINGLSDLLHPCQVVADLQTVAEEFGPNYPERTVAWIGDGNNMANSWLNAAYRLGFSVRLACPEGYDPDPSIFKRAEETADILLTRDPFEAVQGADVVTTDVWASMGQEEEARERMGAFAGFSVDDALMGQAIPDAIFLHCLPRGSEVSNSVFLGEQSKVFQQALNRIYVQKSILLYCFEKLR